MMAQHPEEAAVITSSAGAVMLNMGNITDVRKQSMLISAQTAKQKGIPFVLDVCGSACLPTRREYALGLIGTCLPSVIKGNYSEITALARKDYTSSGVDADKTLTAEAVTETAQELALKLGEGAEGDVAQGGQDAVGEDEGHGLHAVFVRPRHEEVGLGEDGVVALEVTGG
jgi:hydroxyethylthiazole kinase